jgi:hypothetical protein
LVPLLAALLRHEKPYPPMSKNHFRSISSETRTIIPHSLCRKQAGFQVCGMAKYWPEQFSIMRRQDGGVPSKWRGSIGSATGGGRVARKGFHFLVGGQDTQDTQDTHDGGKVGLRASERLAG